uniref:25S rRNA (Cytosine-C(5))-methyltransferase nop2-like n=1 Tax=Dermatophagoides pteronyssinus TaxID=6956 RepID=A0A6P6XPT6_DERPT|nr:25S rRNA (cytosine-C(5))-methyltransferase nop2-like [Dermatophagoides pteronyssinus]
MQQLSAAFGKYFCYNMEMINYFLSIFSTKDTLEFLLVNDAPRPLVIRCNRIRTRRKDLAKRLISRGCQVDVLGDWSKTGLLVTDSTVPVGATPEYLAGHYMIMAASSFLPVLALDAQKNEHILEMAAAPGGKSTFIAEMMENTGILVANDLNKKRLNALLSNIHRLGVRNAIVTNEDGRKLKEYFPIKFDRVLLDAPCSGSGVFSKDPEARIKKSLADFQKMSTLQKELLLSAIDLTNANSPKGGIIVYSTCSIAVEENEAVIDYALRERNIKLLEIDFPGTPGFTRYKDKKFHPSLKNARRVYPHKNGMDGFFFVKIKKLDNSIPKSAKSDN